MLRSALGDAAFDAAWADGFGWPGVTGTILAATWYRGDLVVGGEFAEIGGTSARLVARWDGRTWRPLGSGLTLRRFLRG